VEKGGNSFINMGAFLFDLEDFADITFEVFVRSGLKEINAVKQECPQIFIRDEPKF